MNIERLKLIKQVACKVAKEQVNFKGLERQAIQLSDREYVTIDKKSVDNRNELDFN